MARKFKKLRVVYINNLTPEKVSKLQSYSESQIEFLDHLPKDVFELRTFINEADAILIGYNVFIEQETIEGSPSLQYIGLIGSSNIVVDMSSAHKQGITVSHVSEYCDLETAQFVFESLDKLFDKKDITPFNSSFGIIGMGAVGKQMVPLALNKGYDVIYSSRTRKGKIETKQVRFQSLEYLLKNCSIISLHSPVDLCVLGDKQFPLISKGSIIVNTSKGNVIESKSLSQWLKDKSNFVLMDAVGGRYYPAIHHLPNAFISNDSAWMKDSSIKRQWDQIIENIETFLGQKSMCQTTFGRAARILV